MQDTTGCPAPKTDSHSFQKKKGLMYQVPDWCNLGRCNFHRSSVPGGSHWSA